MVSASQEISLCDLVAAAPRQVSSELAGEAVILDLDRGIYYGLDEVGARVWGMIAQPRSLASVRDALVREFAVLPDDCGRDLLLLADQMRKAGLIVVTRSGDA